MLDILDQPIAVYATLLGYDTVLLQREMGAFRAVTEIIDIRPNYEDFLVQLPSNPTEAAWYQPSEKYPTVWFPSNGFRTFNAHG